METPVENNCFKSSHPYFTDEEVQLQKERYRRASARHTLVVRLQGLGS